MDRVRGIGGAAAVLAVTLAGVAPRAVKAAPAATPAVPAGAPTAAAEPADDEATVRRVRVVAPSRRADGLTASSRTIDADTIRTTPKRSAEDLLRLVPGMHIVQHGNQGKGHQIYVRGFDAVHGSDVEVTVDDIPLNEPSNVHAHGYLDLAQIPADAVAGIDVTKGSYRLRQGNFATAASVHYRLGVTPRDRGTRVAYEVGTTNRHRLSLVHAPKRLPESTFLALEAMRDDGRYGRNRRSERLSGTGKLRLWQRGSASLDGLASLYAARFGLPGVVRTSDVNAGRIGLYGAYTDQTRGESARAIVGLSAAVTKPRHDLRASVYGKGRRLSLDENFTGWLQFPERGDRHHQLQGAGTLGTRAHWAFDVHPRIKLQMHGSWQGNLIEQRQDQLTEAARIWDTSRQLDIRSNAVGLAPGLVALPMSWLTVHGGVRLDVFHHHVVDHLARGGEGQTFADSFVAVSPRVATRARVGDSVELFGAYGRGVRSPEARAVTLPDTPPADTDLSRFAGGRSLVTRTDSTELGARVAPGRIIEFGAAAFGTWIAAESIFDHVSGFNVELGPTRRVGVEADVQVHATPWLHLGADATVVHGRFTHTDAPIPGAPPLLVSTFGTLNHRSGWHAGWRWFLLGPRPLTYGAKAGLATVLDASVGYRHRKWFSIDLSIDNALGLRWREGEYNFASHWDRARPRSQLPTTHAIAGYPLAARLTVTAWF